MGNIYLVKSTILFITKKQELVSQRIPEIYLLKNFNMAFESFVIIYSIYLSA